MKVLLGSLGRLRQQRCLGVYHVRDFRGPDLCIKLGDLRYRWQPGALSAWFAVYDLIDRQELCAFEVSVKNDVENAPVRKRLRSETRARLEAELARAAIEQTRTTLGKVTSVLRRPSSAT